jgi:hypothetical protein
MVVVGVGGCFSDLVGADSCFEGGGGCRTNPPLERCIWGLVNAVPLWKGDGEWGRLPVSRLLVVGEVFCSEGSILWSLFFVVDFIVFFCLLLKFIFLWLVSLCVRAP